MKNDYLKKKSVCVNEVVKKYMEKNEIRVIGKCYI